MNGDLFATRTPEQSVPGLTYIDGFLTPLEESWLVAEVDASVWSVDLRRRVQHYGYRYDYKTRNIDETMRSVELPAWAIEIGARLVQQGLFDKTPDQVIVNEYLPGQGIAQHVDCVPCFGGLVASVSLLSACIMDFEAVQGTHRQGIALRPRSVVVLSGDARFRWRHGIAARKSDVIDGFPTGRRRRLSATFRTVILADDRPTRRNIRTDRRDTRPTLGFLNPL